MVVREDKWQGVLAAVEAAHGARTPAELDAVMAAALKPYGVTSFSMDQIRDAGGAITNVHQAGQWPIEWGLRYIQKKHYRHDWIVRQALAGPGALRWIAAQRRHRLEREEAQLFGDAGAFGLRDGLVTPIHQYDGALSTVAVHAADILDLSPADEMAIQFLSMHYYSYALRLKHEDAKARSGLTGRQRECLQWVRAGKTSSEIGAIMNITERTVNFHVEEACRRLNVATRHQAVIEAMVRGLIAL